MTDVILSSEYIASIRAELNALLAPAGLEADESWRISVDSDGGHSVCLYLNVPHAGDTIEGVRAVVDAQISMNHKERGFWLEVNCGLSYGDD